MPSPWVDLNAFTGDPFFLPVDLANRLQIPPASIDNNVATLLAQLASDAVREDLKLQVDYVADEMVTLWGDDRQILVLPQRPVTAVSSVTLAGQTLTQAQTDTTSTSTYDWRPDGRMYLALYGGSFNSGQWYSNWPAGVPVVVKYSHGWKNGPPTALQSVALDLAGAAYSNPEITDSGRVGWVEWVTHNAGMTLSVQQQRSLDYYRRPFA